ncbi:MAG: response regulator [Candidatus Omnitrophica bacterium]|nr:response regulator [Candidatus Omnitrophota bacterium]
MTTPAQRTRILVVEDNPDFLELLCGRLENWGYEVLKAPNGEASLRIAQAHRPDLILLDVLMPTMKGWDVCAQLKADPNTERIPIIFLTALGLPEHIKAGKSLGADDYLVKPFKPEELQERINTCLLRHKDGSMNSQERRS